MSRYALDMTLESCELGAPQRFGFFKPAFQFCHRFRIERINTHPRIESRMALHHEAAFAQLPHMPAHGGQCQTRPLRQLARAMRPLSQVLDHVAAMRIGERGKRAVDAGDSLAHTQPSILRPLVCSASSRETRRTVCPNDQT